MAVKWQHEGSCGNKKRSENLDGVNINILVVILYYNFARCHHWKKLENVHELSLCYLIKVQMNLKLSPKKKHNEKSKAI